MAKYDNLDSVLCPILMGLGDSALEEVTDKLGNGPINGSYSQQLAEVTKHCPCGKSITVRIETTPRWVEHPTTLEMVTVYPYDSQRIIITTGKGKCTEGKSF